MTITATSPSADDVSEVCQSATFDHTAGDRHPGLDGLRGVAVAWVVAFHLWPEVVRGGWLGVGLFFTLSGYLILGLIDAEVSATGKLHLGRFMARRVRRLMPAALITILAAMALTALLTDQALRTIGLDALTAVLNVFNWHAATDSGGYAAIFEAIASPLEHFWSLAIEEQFYLVVPAVVALTRRPGPVVMAMAVVGLGGVALWWGSTDAYVATPVRALEIAAGAGLALLAVRSETVQRLIRWAPDASRGWHIGSLATVVLALAVTELAVARLGPDHYAVFRGAPQLMSVCWVVLVAASLPRGPLEPLLSMAPMRWLGTRSYAIYLFHWPLIELANWNAFAVIAATLALAELSYRFVEMPIRRQSGLRSVLVLTGTAVAVAATAIAVAAASSPARGAGERASGVTELPAWLTDAPAPTAAFTTSPPSSPSPSSAVDAPAPGASPAMDTPASAPPPATSLPGREGSAEVPIVTVIGDSTGLHMADGLRRWADATRFMAVVDRALNACSPVMTAERQWRVLRTGGDLDPRHLVERDEPCRYSYIEPRSSLVLVVDHAMVMVDHQRSDGSWASILDGDLAADLSGAYRDLAAAARASGARVVFTTAPRWLPLRDDPNPVPPPPTEAARAEAYNELVRALVAELEAADGEPGPGLIDMAAVLDASGYEGRYGRSDGSHIDFDRSELFAAEVLGPALLSLWTETRG